MATALWEDADRPLQGLGLMHVEDDGWGDADRDPAGLVRAAVDAGVTLLDTAELYGNEEIVGRALRGVRDEVLLATKFGVYLGPSGEPDDWSVRADPATVRAAIDGSLSRLGVETVDLYYLHLRSDETPVEETVGAMAELVETGKIRAIGLSNTTAEEVRRAHAVHPVTAVQEEWSLVSSGVEQMLPTLDALGVTLVGHSPTGHGVLHGPPSDALGRTVHELAPRYALTAGQLALAWVHHRSRALASPGIPLPGTTSVRHLRANAAAARVDLDPTDVATLEAARVTTV